MPQVRVEFFGIPRARAGVPVLDVEVDSFTLAAVLAASAKVLPEFAAHCLSDGQLLRGVVANINGREFTTDPSSKLRDGDSVLILSADVGG